MGEIKALKMRLNLPDGSIEAVAINNELKVPYLEKSSLYQRFLTL